MKKAFLIYLFLAGFLSLAFGWKIIQYDANAESLPTNITVGNSPPSITAGPAESTASTGTSPTDEGSDVTFTATANEPNAESYYLAICKSDAVTAGAGGAAPTCDGGAWCVSTATSSDSQASCSHTTVDGDPESNAWYAFVCDNNSTSAECSTTGAQGSGDSGSPFNVNHDPSFSAIVDDGGSGADSGADPGGTMTFTATASDPDTDTASDTVKLVVCADTNGATSSGCTGTEICVSTAAASNPTCNEPIPSVAQDGSVNYYAYVFDSHDLGSSSNYISGSYTINNVAPTVSSVTINGGTNIDLAESTTTNVVVTGTVVDSNSCQDLVTVEASIYRSSVTYTGCDTDAEDDNNNCYAQVSCSVSGGTCTGDTDDSADYTCTVPVQFHADPTVTSTPYVSDTWLSTINAVDSALSDDTEVAAGVEMNTLNAIDLSSTGTLTISYLDLDVGEDTGPMIQDVIISATGNIGLDVQLSGTDMTDGGSGTIGVTNQKYAFCAGQNYTNDGTTLTSSAVENELNIPKTTSTTSPFSRAVYWGLQIPDETIPGEYSGTNTITSVMDESATWGYEDFCTTEGLVGYWKMDESSWNGTTDEVVDSSTNSNDGTAVNGATTTSSGQVNNAGLFDEESSQRVNLGNIGVATGYITVLGWINADDYDVTDGRILSKASGNQEDDHIFMLSLVDFNGEHTRVRLKTGDCGTGSTETIVGQDTGMTSGNWYHVGFAYDGVKTHFFFQGELVYSTYSNATGPLCTSSDDVYIGGNPGSNSNFWEGKIDELRLYDRPLSEIEVNAIYQSESP